MLYNATMYTFKNGQPWGIGACRAAEISGRLQLLRACGHTCTGYEDRVIERDHTITLRDGSQVEVKAGDAAYDFYVRLRMTEMDEAVYIVLDDCAGYRNALRGLMLPPAYRAEPKKRKGRK